MKGIKHGIKQPRKRFTFFALAFVKKAIEGTTLTKDRTDGFDLLTSFYLQQTYIKENSDQINLDVE